MIDELREWALATYVTTLPEGALGKRARCGWALEHNGAPEALGPGEVDRGDAARGELAE